jgi:hypothetical protein
MRIEALVHSEIHQRDPFLDHVMTSAEHELSTVLALAVVAAVNGNEQEIARRCVDFVLHMRKG